MHPHFALMVSADGSMQTVPRSAPSDWINQLCSSLQSIERASKVYLSESFAVAVDSNNALWAVGLDEMLACSMAIHKMQARLIASNIAVEAVACGLSHCIVMTASKCFALGKGEHGQLGLGPAMLHTAELREIPLPSHSPLMVRGVAASSFHSLIVTEPFGEVFSFGSAAYGRLGHESDADVFVPTLVQALVGVGKLLPNGRSTGVRAVGCGLWHSVAVAADTCDVYGWGWNNCGQLGLQCDKEHERSPYHTEEVVNHPRRIECLEAAVTSTDGIRAVHCGCRFTCIQTHSGKLIVM